MAESESQERSSYPKWVYSKKDGEVIGKIVQDPRERAALGGAWVESPVGLDDAVKVRPRGRLRNARS